MPFAVPVLAAIGGGSATAGAIVAGTTVAAGAYSASQKYAAAKSLKSAKYRNAALMEAEAEQANMEDREQIRRQRLVNARYRGTQRATVAGSGVVGNTGSALDALAETAAIQEMGVQDAARAAQSNLRLGYANAAEMRRTGKAVLSAGKRSAVGSLINTGASLAGSYASGLNRMPAGV